MKLTRRAFATTACAAIPALASASILRAAEPDLVGLRASKEHYAVWQDVRNGQALAFQTARLGTSAGEVDDSVRRCYAMLGYGPQYRLAGLSHRTGHGIGMDGHEPVNLVHGETTPLAEGMCFSDEPGLYLPGKFGVRLEDCFHMTANGPKWFSVPPLSLDAPFG